MGSCRPLLSTVVDLGIATLLSLLLSCFWCMRNRRASDYPQDKGVGACQVVPLLFAYQIILLDWVYWLYWLAIYTKVLTDSDMGNHQFFSIVFSLLLCYTSLRYREQQISIFVQMRV